MHYYNTLGELDWLSRDAYFRRFSTPYVIIIVLRHWGSHAIRGPLSSADPTTNERIHITTAVLWLNNYVMTLGSRDPHHAPNKFTHWYTVLVSFPYFRHRIYWSDQGIPTVVIVGGLDWSEMGVSETPSPVFWHRLQPELIFSFYQ